MLKSILSDSHYEQLDPKLLLDMLGELEYIVHVTEYATGKLLFANRPISDTLPYLTATSTAAENYFLPSVVAFKVGHQTKTEYKVTGPTGEVRVLSTVSTVYKQNEENYPTEIIGFTRDITAKHQVQEERLRLSNLLNEAEKLMNFGSWDWNIPKGEVRWSPGSYQIFEVEPPTEANVKLPIGNFMNYAHKDDKPSIMEAITEMKNGIVPINGMEFRIVIPSTNQVKNISMKAKIIEYEAGTNRAKRIIGSNIDSTYITKIHTELEKRLLKLNASNSDLEQFAYVASHDLQEPLRKIMAFSERLASALGDNLSPEAALYLDRILDATQRMRVLINNLLALSRLTNDEEHTIVNLNEVIKNVLKDFELKVEESKAIIKTDFLPNIIGNESQLNQLFTNLIGNALKFTKEGIRPKIEILLRNPTNEELKKYNLDLNKRHIKLIIRDNGIGFDEQYADKIFVIFKRLHGRSTYSGTGIGLAICRKVVDNHDGVIYTQSQEGKGASFSIILPLS